MPKEITTIFTASLPVLELRWAIPQAVTIFGLSPLKAYLFSVAGNLIPVVPLLLFFKHFFHSLERSHIVGRLFRWWFSSVDRRSALVRKWGFWGLALFVAIPLPVTGAWTGTVAATLIDMKIHKAFLAIMLGVFFAGFIVLSATLGIDYFCSAG